MTFSYQAINYQANVDKNVAKFGAKLLLLLKSSKNLAITLRTQKLSKIMNVCMLVPSFIFNPKSFKYNSIKLCMYEYINMNYAVKLLNSDLLRSKTVKLCIQHDAMRWEQLES